jgi:L-ascorbate metabolism protein UlaG (beta-lactamase superfamily)
MKTRLILLFIFFVAFALQPLNAIQSDTIQTSNGKMVIQFVGHGSLIIEFNKKEIFIDPFSRLADYSTFKKADLILITHTHPDHLDTVAIGKILKENTSLIYTAACKKIYGFNGKGIVMENGNQKDMFGIHIEAVPAYNIVGKRPDGQFFHPKGEGNGYILTIGGKRIYVAGDTENIPEMKTFKNIDFAFLPMNLPYTMTPEQMADAALMVHPKVLYPYHYGETDVSKLVELLKEHKEIEIRIREMK